MKKLVLTVALLLATSLSVMAGNENSNKLSRVEAYTLNVNVNSLARYLELSKDQVESVENIQNVFSESLRCAAVMETDESRKNMVKSAIEFDLKNLSYVLSKEQYKKYLKVLNVTLINRGIENK
jgi:hypothetical protein